MKTVFIRAIEAPVDEKAGAIREAMATACRVRFDVDLATFGRIPRSPFAYWVSAGVSAAFSRFAPFEGEDRSALGGLKTLNDPRFVRLWWECSSETGDRWPALAKGGRFSPYYADVYLRVHWGAGGRDISWYGYQRRPREGFGAASRGIEAYFRPGLTWPRRTNGLSFRVMPRGCIFADKGPAAFIEGDAPVSILALSALVNSGAFGALVAVQLARTELAQSYEVGLIQQTPVPQLLPADEATLAELARQSWSIKRGLDTRTENSHAFTLPAMLQAAGDTLAARAEAWLGRVTGAEAELASLQAEVDAHAFRLYGLSDEDRAQIERGFDTGAGDEGEEDEDERDDAPAELEAGPLVQALLSWSVGAAFGRFDVRLATGEREAPSEPEPFDPLPVCSPGMLTGDDGLPVAAPPPGYPLTFPTDGILVDDPGHPRDVVRAARAVFEAIFDDANARWHEAAELLGAPDLRSWFARDFFEPHIKRYSKSRRKAPIYWQLATASGSYSVWLYIHRATGDTLFRVLNDFVGPKLDHEKAKLDGLTQEAGGTPSAAQRREIEQQETFVGELQALKTEVARVAPLWKPNLDDGVILNFAPLWRLVPQSRSWQGECKKAWDKLQAGDYDWAHLAMHLWPERVVPKCVDDRSLAIAHGLDEVFWREDLFGAWSRRVDTPFAYATADIEAWRSSVAFVLEQMQRLALESPAVPVALWWQRVQTGDGPPILVAQLFPEVAKERMEKDETFRRSLVDALEQQLVGQGAMSSRENQTLMVRLLSLRSLRNAYTTGGADHALNEVKVLTQSLRPAQLRTILARFADEVGPSLTCGEAADLLDRGALGSTWLGCRSLPDLVTLAQDNHSFARTTGLDLHLWTTHPTTGAWHPRLPPADEVERQIAWRTSAAVKAALTDLLSAPSPSTAPGRRARGTTAAAPRSTPKPAPATPERARVAASPVDAATLAVVQTAIASVAEGASKADVLSATGISDSDWNKAITALLDRGDVTRTGQKRGTRYHSTGGSDA